MQRQLILLAALSLAACKSSTSPLGPLQGSWSGSVPAEFTIDVSLRDQGGSVSGTGDIAGPAIAGGGPFFLSIAGGENGSTYRLTLSSQGFTQSVTATGTLFSKDTVTAFLSGSGFSGDSLELVRQ